MGVLFLFLNSVFDIFEGCFEFVLFFLLFYLFLCSVFRVFRLLLFVVLLFFSCIIF